MLHDNVLVYLGTFSFFMLIAVCLLHERDKRRAARKAVRNG